MRYQGKVTNWNDEKGYGFVEPNGGGDRAFVHIKSFSKPARRPVAGDIIVYSVIKEKDGRCKAAKVTFSRSAEIGRKSEGHGRTLGSIITIAFCIFLVVATILDELPIEVLVFYTGASVLAFVAYAQDKSAAKSNRWRTKESMLHLFGIIGGWPGAFFAQNRLRHKSKKAEFKFVFWLTVLINVGITFYLFTGGGANFLRSIVGAW